MPTPKSKKGFPVFQVRIGTEQMIEHIVTVEARDINAAEVKAAFSHDVKKHGKIRYTATSRLS